MEFIKLIIIIITPIIVVIINAVGNGLVTWGFARGVVGVKRAHWKNSILASLAASFIFIPYYIFVIYIASVSNIDLLILMIPVGMFALFVFSGKVAWGCTLSEAAASNSVLGFYLTILAILMLSGLVSLETIVMALVILLY